VLAHYRDEPGLHVGVFPLPITLDAYPLEGPLFQKGGLIVNGEVILNLAGDDAGLAAGAAVQVYDHTPSVV
jgi:hypothetical protein